MPRPNTENQKPTKRDAELARAASDAIANSGSGSLRVGLAGQGQRLKMLDLPKPALKLLTDLLRELGAGKPVAIVASDAEIGTQEAADLLNVSRPYVVSLIEKGMLPARTVGRERRLPLADVVAYKQDNRAKRRAALDELTELDQELGLR